jgi:predicted N-acetyltransferase YhbS
MISHTVLELRGNTLTPSQLQAIGRLIARCFPTPGISEEDRIREYSGVGDSPDHEVFVVFGDDCALAHALLFPREILTHAGLLRVGALAAVCTDPDHRGKGLGREVVRAAFARVEAGAYPVSLFQTGVPDFYAKLGSRTIHNTFINSRWQPPAEGRSADHSTRDAPWWNPFVMIFPATYAWPEGEVDLVGPGF